MFLSTQYQQQPSLSGNLRLNHFVVDVEDRIWRISAQTFETLWHDGGSTRNVVSDGQLVNVGEQLRHLTVLSDENWQPLVTFLLRVDLIEDRLRVADRYRLYRALSGKIDGPLEKQLVQHQLSGWPADWQSQLAVAMDVPSSQFKKVSIGGPLVMADLWGMSVSGVLEHFRVSMTPEKGTN